MDKKSKKKTSKINSWKPNKNQVIVEPDGKLFICHFDKVFNVPKLKAYNRFMINKGSYENQLDIITKYANFFMAFYDQDQELPMAYLKLKTALDKYNKFGPEDMGGFISFVYEIMLTQSMVNKITKLVDENYLDDIETETEEKKKYQKNEKKHLESLEFTNEQIKILLRISFAMKIMSPVMFHYFYKNVIKIDKDSDYIFRFFHRLFKIFGYGEKYEYYDQYGKLIGDEIEPSIVKNGVACGRLMEIPFQYDEEGNTELRYYDSDKNYYVLTRINMYNKLYVYVKAKVLESNSNNSPMFEQREIFGIDVFTVIHHFTQKVLISENIVKYKFNETWNEKTKKYKESVIGFNKTIIQFQLNYFLKEQYKKNLTEVTNTKNSEGLSGKDKMAMNIQKIDEGAIIMAELNIKLTINKIKKMIDVPIPEEEIDFYTNNMKPIKVQINLVSAYYARYFGSYRDLNLLPRRDYMTLAILLKKKLLIELGFEAEDGTVHQAVLPYLLTGNLKDKINNRVIRNNCFINKTEEDYLYNNLVNEDTGKFRFLEEIDPGYIKAQLSTLINTKFTYVTYEEQSLLGEEIEYNENKVNDEALFFLNSLM